MCLTIGVQFILSFEDFLFLPFKPKATVTPETPRESTTPWVIEASKGIAQGTPNLNAAAAGDNIRSSLRTKGTKKCI